MPGITVKRDVRDIGEWKSIREFMQSIRQQDYAALIVSDYYLKSRNCMFEVVEIMKEQQYQDRIFPAVVEHGVYDPLVHLEYIKYWLQECDKLENAIKGIDMAYVAEAVEELKRKKSIAASMGEFLKLVADMNYSGDSFHPITAMHKKHLHEIGQKIAFAMFEKDSLELDKNEYVNVITSVSDERMNDFSIANYYDIGNTLTFSHKSIYEYFVAEYIFQGIKAGFGSNDNVNLAERLGMVLKGNMLSREINEFLSQKMKCCETINNSYWFFIVSFDMMSSKGMTFYTGKCFESVMHCEANIFKNMMDILHNWELKKNELIFFNNEDAFYKNILFASFYNNNINLSGVYLCGVNLSGADLRGTYLSGADLSGTYLNGTNLVRADLRGAYLEAADLRGARFLRTDLDEADLDGAIFNEDNIDYIEENYPDQLNKVLVELYSGETVGYAEYKKRQSKEHQKE